MCLERAPLVLLVNPNPSHAADLARDVEARGCAARTVGSLSEALAILAAGDVTHIVFDARRGAMATSAIAAGVGAAYPWIPRVWLHGEGPLPIVAHVVRRLLGDPVSVEEWGPRLLGTLPRPAVAGLH